MLSREIVSFGDFLIYNISFFARLSWKEEVGFTCYIMVTPHPRSRGDSRDAHDTGSGSRQQVDMYERCLIIAYRVPAVKSAATPIFCFQGS